MLYFLEIIIGFIIFMAGASVFSFLNVVADRVPQNISFIKGHSRCMDCGHDLAPWDLVPIFSWMFLRGKCRYCRAAIPGRCTVMELMGGVLALLTIYKVGFNWDSLLIYLFIAMLAVVALVDWDTMEIPNGFVIAILILAVIRTVLFVAFPYIDSFIGFFVVSLPLFLITMFIPGAFGGGDIKLMAACGLFLGWTGALLAFFFAVLGGGSYGIYLLASKKKGKKEHFPFGPFLCVGMWISLMWGSQLLDWYLGFFRF